MPRPREFDPETALDAAMCVFWQRGFVETSYDDLVTETGVSRRGLYTVFGDKHQLFLATLQHYRNTVIPHLFGALDDPNITKDGIRDLFRSFVKLSDSPGGARGCYMARTSSDEAISHAEVKSIIDAHWADLHSRFDVALKRAGYDPERSERMAHYCVGVMQGILLMAHARAGKDRIEPFVEEALKNLT
ncbi:TetR/AcrR family transcriptional regulator [Litoreibacter roseus]|uniref:TetR family transcriptional regulator n=1 Tax=Litoreibacter roseus TaxID=2601869 RepID=A0A6N6JKS9_9RHOB|nr:TetR/AcrR family transcriptional regulator [Litoreibacter roseus]GFE65878.1 TetR family transcriptional regulator [Litoreibacter roseus]